MSTTPSTSSAAPVPWLDGAQARRILGLAGPVILAMLTQTGVNIVDTYFLGLLPPADASDAQAALTPSLMFLWAAGGFLSAVGVGTQAVVARRHGEGDDPAAGAVVPNAALITLIGGLVLGVAGWIAMPSMYSRLVDVPHVAELGTAYTRWRFVGIASMAATAAYKAFFDGIGRTHLHLYAAILMNILNAVLCWVLIFGHLGAPAMGVEGAGVAAAMASWLGLAVMVGFSLAPATVHRFRFYHFGNLSLSTVWNLLRLSVPSGIATVVVMTGFMLFTKIVSRLDNAHPMISASGLHVAANGAATTIIIEVLSATFFSCLAFGTATATLVGQSLGRKDPGMAERYAWTSVKLGVLIFGTIGALMLVFAPQVLHVFSKEEAVIAVGTAPLRLVSACGALVAVGMILTQALFGAGDTRFVMFVEFGLHFGCLVPLAWLFGLKLDLGLTGVFCSVAAYVLGLSVAMAARFSAGHWKRLQV